MPWRYGVSSIEGREVHLYTILQQRYTLTNTLESQLISKKAVKQSKPHTIEQI